MDKLVVDWALSQSKSTMFERNIARIASRRLFTAITTDIETYRGFICGLDEKWIQICGFIEVHGCYSTGPYDLILIRLDSITSIESQHVTSDGTNESGKVDEKIRNFANISKAFLDRRKSSAN
jgi:hypothetical protein